MVCCIKRREYEPIDERNSDFELGRRINTFLFMLDRQISYASWNQVGKIAVDSFQSWSFLILPTAFMYILSDYEHKPRSFIFETIEEKFDFFIAEAD